MKKILQIVQDVKIESVEIERYPDLLLVYYQISGSEKSRIFMYRKDFEKLASRDRPLDGEKDFVPASVTGHDYVTAFFLETVESLDRNGYINWYAGREWKIKWGEKLPDDMILMGFNAMDYSYFNMDGSRHVHPISVSPCNMMGFRAEAIAEAIQEGKFPDVRFNSDESLDYVPGNGATVYACITLSPEEFLAYKSNRDSLRDYHLCKEVFKDFFVDRDLTRTEDEEVGA